MAKRIAIVARLQEGENERAMELVAKGPPFDPSLLGFERHAVYLSFGEIIFLFEGPEATWKLDDLVTDPFHPELQAAFDAWRPILAGPPRIAREVFYWPSSL